MRRSAPLSAMFLLGLSAALAAQQPTFRAGVSLVTVDVTVLDKDGKPVPGLSAADFDIKLNGKLQPVRAIAFLEAASPGDAPPAPAPAANASGGRLVEAPKPVGFAAPKEIEVRRTVSNQDDQAPTPSAAAPSIPSRPSARPKEPRTFVILIDDLSFLPADGKKMFNAAEKFVRSVPAADTVGFTTASGSLTVNPTLDRTAVTAGLARVVGQYVDPRLIDPSGRSFSVKETREQPLGIDQSLEIERGNDSELRTAIMRECLGGLPSAVAGMATSQLIQSSDCAAGIAAEAQRTARLTKQVRARQLDALKSALNAMRSARGIRHLIWITNGIAMQTDLVEIQPLIVAAAAAGIQLSVVMEDPDNVSMANPISAEEGNRRPRPDGGFFGRVREDNRLVLNGAQLVNDMLGGTFYRVIGDPESFFDRVLIASSAVYRLGVEMPAATPPGKELSLGVDIKRPGLTARANKMAINVADNALATPAAPPDAPKAIAEPAQPPIDDVLKAALNQNQALRGVPIRLGAAMRRSTSSPGQIEVSVSALMPSSAKTPITALLGVVDEAGALRFSRRVVDNTVDAVQFLLPLAAGNYAIRFAAADAEKALGTVELPLAVKLHALGGFTSSDVMTWVLEQKATLFATDDVPADGKLHASIELYPSGPMPGEAPGIRWTVTREGETKPVVEDELDAQAGQSLFRSDLEIPFESLAPGTYIIRATLLVADKPAGSVGATIRKR